MKKIFLALLLTFAMHSGYATFYPPSAPPPNHGRILGLGEHLIIGLSGDGTIELHNQAKFRVHPSDTYDVKYWRVGECITFSQNSTPFSSSDYYVINKDRNETVRANLWGGPFYDNMDTYRIVEINSFRCEVVLKNGNGYPTRWAIDPNDMHLLDVFQLGDTALIGKNSSCFSWLISSAPNILVSFENTDLVAYVRCTPIY